MGSGIFKSSDPARRAKAIVEATTHHTDAKLIAEVSRGLGEPMRAFAMTGMETAAMISRIFSGSLMRATPPMARMSAGTRSSAITATAPASSAIFACSAVTTSMITPPLSIWARPVLSVQVPVRPGALEPLEPF